MPAVHVPPVRCSLLSDRLTGVARAAAVSAVLSLGGWHASAAPVTGSQAEAVEPSAAAAPAGAAPAPAGAAARPEVSTGNRNLDLLLEMQGRGGEAALAASQPASRPSGLAKLPVPLPNTNLSGGVMNEVRAAPGTKPAAHNAELLGDLGGGMSARPSTEDPTARREWVGQAGGGSRADDGLGGHESRPRGGHVEEPAILRSMREAIEWLREHRWQVLGVLLGIAALSGLLKAYSRRPER